MAFLKKYVEKVDTTKNWQKLFSEKNTALNKKSKLNRPFQNHPKNWPDWQSQGVLTIFKEVMAIFFTKWFWWYF